MTHSPEPWKLTDEGFDDWQDNPILDDDYSLPGDADRCRIVACVNFCQGLSTDTLTRFGDAGCPAMAWRNCTAAEDIERNFWLMLTAGGERQLEMESPTTSSPANNHPSADDEPSRPDSPTDQCSA